MSTTEHITIAITADMFPCPACGGTPTGTIDTLVCRWGPPRDRYRLGWERPGHPGDALPGRAPGPVLREWP